MPKGAVLHIHPDASVNVSWVIDHFTYDDRLWLCGDLGTGLASNTIRFLYSDNKTGQTSVEFRTFALENHSVGDNDHDGDRIILSLT